MLDSTRITSDFAKNVVPGDILNHFGEVIEVERSGCDRVTILYFDGFLMMQADFHIYEDVEIVIW